MQEKILNHRYINTARTYFWWAYDQIDNIFMPREAWGLFKIAAYAETIGWSLLITGIVFKKFTWPLHDWILPLAGSFHGLVFIFYVLIVLFAHRSMNWRFRHFVIAEVLGNIPFGALVFERYIVKKRQSLS
ncbi:DUF3817 domain-containing protein [bacterium]|nr:MAG: DUF3817 domain-containing protein [bacterium]